MENKEGKGIGFLGALTLVFITLKLCKVVSWSWLWILSPLWIPIAILIIVALLLVIVEILKK